MSDRIVRVYASQDWVGENTVKSFDELEGKPFGETTNLTPVEGEYTSGTITVEDGCYDIRGDNNASLFLEVEDSYYVEWDGVLYETNWNADNAIGNPSLNDSDMQDTGEPFYIMQGLTRQYVHIYANEDGEHVYVVYTGNKTINSLDDKYIPGTIARTSDVDTKITSPSTATVGQTIVVKAVDDSGKPTEWECVNMSSNEWELLTNIELTEVGAIDKITYDTAYKTMCAILTIPKVETVISTSSAFTLLHGYGLYYASIGNTNYPHVIELYCEKWVVCYEKHFVQELLLVLEHILTYKLEIISLMLQQHFLVAEHFNYLSVQNWLCMVRSNFI